MDTEIQYLPPDTYFVGEKDCFDLVYSDKPMSTLEQSVCSSVGLVSVVVQSASSQTLVWFGGALAVTGCIGWCYGNGRQFVSAAKDAVTSLWRGQRMTKVLMNTTLMRFDSLQL